MSPSTVRATRPTYVAILAGCDVASDTGASAHCELTARGRHVHVPGSSSWPGEHVARHTQAHWLESHTLLTQINFVICSKPK